MKDKIMKEFPERFPWAEHTPIEDFLSKSLDEVNNEWEDKYCKATANAERELIEQGERFEALFEYCVHGADCLCSQFREGKPTDDGDYLTSFGYGEQKKWYSRNENEKPQCSCGLNALQDEKKGE